MEGSGSQPAMGYPRWLPPGQKQTGPELALKPPGLPTPQLPNIRKKAVSMQVPGAIQDIMAKRGTELRACVSASQVQQWALPGPSLPMLGRLQMVPVHGVDPAYSRPTLDGLGTWHRSKW